MNEHEITEVHRLVRGEANAQRADERRLDNMRERALDRADRREWSQRKFVVGGETRWQETQSEPRRPGRRRFIYDPALDAVVELN